MREAGLRHIQVHVRVITEREFAPNTLGYHQAQVIDHWLRQTGNITPTQLHDFQADLRHTAARGNYLFTLNRYICLGRPAPHSS